MEIRNTIGWTTPWLERLASFCCRELEYDPKRVRFAWFSLAHNGRYRGWARLDERKIRVKINPLNAYPLSDGKAVKSLPELIFADAVELVVAVSAHEIAHLERYERFARTLKLQGKRDTGCERDTEWLARQVLGAFRKDRGRLLAEWGESGPGPLPPGKIHRLTCPSCGAVYDHARAPSAPRDRFCRRCFPTREIAFSVGKRLVYEIVVATPPPSAC